MDSCEQWYTYLNLLLECGGKPPYLPSPTYFSNLFSPSCRIRNAPITSKIGKPKGLFFSKEPKRTVSGQRTTQSGTQKPHSAQL